MHNLIETEPGFAHALFDSVRDGLVVLDLDAKKFTYSNPAFCAMTGYTAEEIRQFGPEGIHPAEDIPHLLVELERQVRGEITLVAGVTLVRKDGGRRLVDINSAPTTLHGRQCMVGSFRDITEQHNIEEAERRNRELAEEAQRLAKLGRWTLDLANGKLTWSDEIFRIFEINQKKFGATYEAFLNAIHPEDRALVNDTYSRSVAEHGSYRINHRLLMPDGRIKHVQETGVTRYASDGTPLESIGTVQDITELTQIQLELRRKQEVLDHQNNLFTLLLKTLPIGVFMVEAPSGKPVLANEAARAMLGRGILPEAQSQNLGEVYDALKLSTRQRYPTGEMPILRGLKGESSRIDDMVVMRPDGTERNLEVFGSPVTGLDGEIAGSLVCFIDITERKRTEVALAAEKERLSVTLRSIGDGVITTDTTGKILIMNRVAEELTGWSQRDAHGLPLEQVFRILGEESRIPCESPVTRVISLGHTVELEGRTLLVARDGTERIIADSGAPIQDSQSRTVGVVLVFRDISEKQRLLDRLQQADKLEAIGVLAGGIAHDFNNLLGGIYGYIDLARELTPQGSEPREYLDKSFAVFERAKDLTQQLLTFAKGGAPIRKTGSLAVLLQKSVPFALSGSNIAAEFRLPEGLWLCDFDENQLGQVIDNVVINAKQAMPEGGRLTITARNLVATPGHPLLTPGSYVEIELRDTGVGIPSELLPRVYDPFFTTKQKGNGLGLATCYSILQKAVHFYLPSAAALSDAVDTDSEADQVAEDLVKRQGRGRLLVMDDEDYILEILDQILTRMGFEVVLAIDGAEALHYFARAEEKRLPFDGAILDLTIPGGMGGRELVVQLRARYPQLPIFASSGYSEDPVMADPKAFGFTDRICKPYRRSEIVELLERSLRRGD